MGIASDILSRDITAEYELEGKAALVKLPYTRTITVVRESWREDDNGELDLTVDGEIEVTTYVKPSVVDIVDVITRVNIDHWQDTPSGARIYCHPTNFYGTTVRNYVSVPQLRSEQYVFTLSGFSPERLRVIRETVGIRDNEYYA